MIHEQEFVCFCLNKRHPNIFMGRRLPSNCRYCNAQFDLMSIIPKAEAEAKGLLKMPEEAAPQPEEKNEPQTPAAPTVSAAPAAQQSAAPAAPSGFGFGRPAAAAPQQSAAPAAPSGFGFGRPAAAAPQQSAAPAAPSGFGFGRPASAAPQQSAAPAAPSGFGFGMNRPAAAASFGMGFTQQAAPAHTPAVEAYQLDFFGEKIAIPQEGGWLGRSALGAQWFKGNLLISREHVKIVPMANGRLQIGPDKSLNGVSVTIGGVKKALGRSEIVELSAGDTLWLYNIPLQLERK